MKWDGLCDAYKEFARKHKRCARKVYLPRKLENQLCRENKEITKIPYIRGDWCLGARIIHDATVFRLE